MSADFQRIKNEVVLALLRVPEHVPARAEQVQICLLLSTLFIVILSLLTLGAGVLSLIAILFTGRFGDYHLQLLRNITKELAIRPTHANYILSFEINLKREMRICAFGLTGSEDSVVYVLELFIRLSEFKVLWLIFLDLSRGFGVGGFFRSSSLVCWFLSFDLFSLVRVQFESLKEKDRRFLSVSAGLLQD